ncbi:hypothetical protein [Paraburkholderia caballeronis]|uniref:Uncharacterized protein n=1 Tax=Paraburkholderia caballeronis TaxID=416943 RepID=A0A1H7L1H8_9BURK|nr:hypothetical protein [Paraburkholderia caballeronis]PXW28256.1 hypothetical protein C7403_102148 [Paraburkholderia caballeronis]PXX03622.1 hypothetical protein C7407_102148 [Paraburkholderia caballeronis]RAK04366.1 hypothetical protein C7409_102148 [Paraburkholderia caballeronis]SED83077.1 hypothetical protein SAMN05445871_4031 [Paraburkholderia caballeronis]SEK92889.1 hypothetical protein SAMN05192542_104148 [Paraburkholderia caballeronis]
MTQPLSSRGQKTLLKMVQEVMTDLGLPQPQTVIGNTDNTVRQMLVHMTRIGEELSERGGQNEGWQVLRKEWAFQLVGFGGITGDATAGSPVITNLTTTADLETGMIASGAALPYGATILSIDSPSQITLDLPAAVDSSDTDFSFGNESYEFPDDVDHFITQTGWDRSFRWQLVGPLSAQEWQVLKSGISPTGPRLRWRIMDGRFFVNPVPGSQDRLVMEYYSTGWCQSAAGVPQTAWAADTDTPVLQDKLFILGALDRFLMRKGLDSTVSHEEYERAVETALARSAGMRVLPINARAQPPVLLGSANVPDTGFGS